MYSGKVQAQRANDPAFVKAVGEALTLTQSHLVRQTDPVMRTRSLDYSGVSSRFAQVGRYGRAAELALPKALFGGQRASRRLYAPVANSK